MLISPKHQFIYVAAPKCASKSIHAALYPEVEEEMTPELLDILRMHDSHATLVEVEPYVKLAGINTAGFYTFGVKRNPYDRLVSYAAWEYPEMFSYEPHLAIEAAIVNHDRMARPQTFFLEGVKYLFAFEELNTEWRNLTDYLEIRPVELPKENESNRDPDFEKYFTPELKIAAQRKYAKDFEVLGYAK